MGEGKTHFKTIGRMSFLGSLELLLHSVIKLSILQECIPRRKRGRGREGEREMGDREGEGERGRGRGRKREKGGEGEGGRGRRGERESERDTVRAYTRYIYTSLETKGNLNKPVELCPCCLHN